jgi:pyruvate kinase
VTLLLPPVPGQVLEVLDDTRVRGRVLNTHKLGQRKNCNLPGVLVDLPVLGPKDIDDVRNFAARHQMDYVFASFVQRAEDVRIIRAVSLGRGGPGRTWFAAATLEVLSREGAVACSNNF